MKCKKCENEDFAFVSVTVQDGKEDIFFKTIGIINLLIFIVGIIIAFVAVTDYMESSSWEISEYFVFIGVSVFLVIIPGTIFFLCSSFRKLMPYKTHDEIKCICRHCGHTETVKEETQANTEATVKINDDNSFF